MPLAEIWNTFASVQLGEIVLIGFGLATVGIWAWFVWEKIGFSKIASLLRK